MQIACRNACVAYRKKEYKKALEFLLIAEREAKEGNSEVGVVTTVLKRIQHNITVCRSQLDESVSLVPIESMIDRKGKSKTTEDPTYFRCSKFNNALILFHQGKFQDATTVLHPLIVCKGNLYLKALLLLFEIHIRTGNLEGTHHTYQQMDALPQRYLTEDWKKAWPYVLQFLKAKMHSTSLPILHLDSVKDELAPGFEIRLVFCSTNILGALENPELASRYTQALAVLVRDISPLFRSYYQALLYHYLSLINEKLKCFTAAQLYALKSSDYAAQFVKIGFKL
jgi:hypothetical protein